MGPILLYDELLVDFAHGIALDCIYHLQKSWNLIRHGQPTLPSIRF